MIFYFRNETITIFQMWTSAACWILKMYIKAVTLIVFFFLMKRGEKRLGKKTLTILACASNCQRADLEVRHAWQLLIFMYQGQQMNADKSACWLGQQELCSARSYSSTQQILPSLPQNMRGKKQVKLVVLKDPEFASTNRINFEHLNRDSFEKLIMLKN